MKKVIFVVIIFVSLVLFAEEMNTEETNWINISGFTTTKEVIRLTVTRLRGRFIVQILNFGKRERQHDVTHRCSCYGKKHF